MDERCECGCEDLEFTGYRVWIEGEQGMFNRCYRCMKCGDLVESKKVEEVSLIGLILKAARAAHSASAEP